MDLRQQCSVCLDSMATRSRPVCQLGCGHWFHEACVSEHAQGSASGCPLCRATIEHPPPVARLVPVEESDEDDDVQLWDFSDSPFEALPWMRVASDASVLRQINANTLPQVAAYSSAIAALAAARGETADDGSVHFLVRLDNVQGERTDMATARFWASVSTVLSRRLMARANTGDPGLEWITSVRIMGAGTEELCAIAGAVMNVTSRLIARNEGDMRRMVNSVLV